MNCEFCNHPFNLSNRLPLILPCCGDTACKQCITDLTGEPQQKGFTCPAQDCKEPNQDQSTLKPNKKLERDLKKSLGILCDKHPQSQAEVYCHTHNVLICTACSLTTHLGHQCQQIQKDQLINYNDKILEFLRIELERIRLMISEVEGYQQNEKQLTSEQYLNIVNDAQNSLKPKLNQQQQNEIKFPPFKFDQQHQEEEKKQEQPPQQQLQIIDQIQYNANNQVVQANKRIQEPKEEEKKEKIQQVQRPLPQQQNVIDSILIKQTDYQLLKEYFNTDNLTLQLIYRGTDHGFTTNTFHKRCDNQGPTLTVAFSQHDQLFGGYTSISWESGYRQFKQDSQAFLFQLTKKFKLTQYQNQQKAVQHYYGIGPVFGGGLDLAIGGYMQKDFDKDNGCYSNIHDIKDRTYSLPLEIQNNKEEAKKYLAGSEDFKLKELEVFKVIIK